MTAVSWLDARGCLPAIKRLRSLSNCFERSALTKHSSEIPATAAAGRAGQVVAEGVGGGGALRPALVVRRTDCSTPQDTTPGGQVRPACPGVRRADDRIASALERIATAMEAGTGVRPEHETTKRPEPTPEPPEWVSTRSAARLLHVRNTRLYEASEDGIRDGVARNAGSAVGERKHVRWRQDLLPGWWQGRTT